ncbi:MAG: chemotaxis protein CheD [Vallitaleaceae bacterium]|nr:chemotaxis protein CheD [Vallitaleaceae bacterium]
MITVGLGEYAISVDEKEELITYSLGSCVALILRCPNTKKTAMAHIVLPKAEREDHYTLLSQKPGYFANRIVPKLICHFLQDTGCTVSDLEVILVGGANSMNDQDIFRIGSKNVEEIQRILEQYQLKPKEIDVGGFVSRTVRIAVHSGVVQVAKTKMII